MNIFELCLPKRTGSRIYLPVEDEEDFETNNISHRNCFSCCLWRRPQSNGLIRLPEGSHGRRTVDDYLDPRSPVSIEVLLEEQEQELDHYMGQTDDEDAYDANSHRKSAISYSLMDEEDAQFLTEHRISAILVERPKLSSAHVFDQESNIVSKVSDSQIQPQELLGLDLPAPSTSTSTISSRVFAIKTQPKVDDFEEEQHFTQRPITDALHITSSPIEITETTTYNTGHSSPSSSSSSATLSSAENNNSSFLHPIHPIGSSNSLSVFPVSSTTNESNNNSSLPSRSNDFPATTLTRTPYQPSLPIMQHDNIPTSIHTTSSAVILNNTSTSSTTSTQPSAAPVMGRRPSVVAAAQSLLGDKLDDFTEKLAFIKKNIIMSLDSEDEEELSSQNNYYYNTQILNNSNNKNRNRASLDHNITIGRDSQQSAERNKSWDTFILPKFKKQPSTSTSFLQQKKQQEGQQQSRFPRSSSIEQNNNAVPLNVTRNETRSDTNHIQELAKKNPSYSRNRRGSNASSASSTSNGINSEDEEIFDFSKVVAMSKNVRTFGEGVMGNGLRMFNNLSTRIKNNNTNPNESNDQRKE